MGLTRLDAWEQSCELGHAVGQWCEGDSAALAGPSASNLGGTWIGGDHSTRQPGSGLGCRVCSGVVAGFGTEDVGERRVDISQARRDHPCLAGVDEATGPSCW